MSRSTDHGLDQDLARIQELGSLSEILDHLEEFTTDTQDLIKTVEKASKGDLLAFTILAELLGELEPGYTDQLKRRLASVQ